MMKAIYCSSIHIIKNAFSGIDQDYVHTSVFKLIAWTILNGFYIFKARNFEHGLISIYKNGQLIHESSAFTFF